MRRYLKVVQAFSVAVLLANIAANPAAQLRAVGDGITDDTDALQDAVAAAVAQRRGGTVQLQRGDFRLTRTLTISEVQGLRIIGVGNATRLIWDGDETSPAILLRNVRDSQLEHLQLTVATNRKLAVGIRIIQGSPYTIASRHNTLSFVEVEGVDGRIGIGVQIGGAAGVDLNNDMHRFDTVEVMNYTNAAWSLEGSQAYGILFTNSYFNGGTAGQYGVRTDAWQDKGGSFTWQGGGGGTNAVADFRLGAPTAAPSAIRDAWFEGSARFIQTVGPSGAPYALSVENNRWAANRVASDRVFIDFRFPGPLQLRGNTFGDALPVGDQLKVLWSPINASVPWASFAMDSNEIRRNRFAYVGWKPTSEINTVVFTR